MIKYPAQHEYSMMNQLHSIGRSSKKDKEDPKNTNCFCINDCLANVIAINLSIDVYILACYYLFIFLYFFYLFGNYQNMEKRLRRLGGEVEPKTDTENGINQLEGQSRCDFPSPIISDRVKKDRLRIGVRNLYGRHYPVRAKPEYNFLEQWESKPIEFGNNNFCEIIQAQTLPAYIYTVIMLLSHIALFWYLSVLHLQCIPSYIDTTFGLIIGLATAAIDSSIRFYLQYLRVPSREAFDWRVVVRKYRGQGFLLIYYILNLAVGKQGQNEVVMYMMDALAIYLVFLRSRSLFQLFKIRSYTTSYKHKMKLLDLLGTLLLFLHLFVPISFNQALLLYLASFYDSETNWAQKVGSPPPEGIDRYFYAFYFAATTMLTIGYGDLSPTNKVEILAVLPVQILGVAIFSYIISEIGYTVSSTRKQEEQLQRNLSTLVKMEKFYHMEEELSNITRQNLVSNQKSFQTVYPQDEEAVLSKLNDELRDTVQFNNGLDIVKTSLFFVCHWTKHFQAEIARNLTKKILHPNELLLQVPGKQKIFIVRNGKLQIYTNCNNNYKQQFKKLLKTVAPQDRRVSDNVYGYTNLISCRPVRLAAVSKEFTSVYYLSKEKFMKCINQTELDREYFFEIKDKIDQSKCLESFETPAVLNIRYHYRPSEFFILKRHTHNMQEKSNKRAFYLRNKRVRGWKSLDIKSQLKMAKTIEQTLKERTFKLYSCSQEFYPKEIMIEIFQISKEYHNYFRPSNLSLILAKLQRQNPKIVPFHDPKMPRYQGLPQLTLREVDEDGFLGV